MIKSIVVMIAVICVMAFTVQQKDRREHQQASAAAWQELEQILGFPPTPSQRLEDRLAQLLDESVKAGDQCRALGDKATGAEKAQAADRSAAAFARWDNARKSAWNLGLIKR